MPEREHLEDEGRTVTNGGDVDVEAATSRTVITLYGEIDAALDDLLSNLCDIAVTAGHAVTVDVTDVTFMDSTGASFLIRLYRGVSPERVTLLHPTPAVRYLLNVTQLVRFVDTAPD